MDRFFFPLVTLGLVVSAILGLFFSLSTHQVVPVLLALVLPLYLFIAFASLLVALQSIYNAFLVVRSWRQERRSRLLP